MEVNTKMTCPGIVVVVGNRKSFNKERQSESGHFQLNAVYTKG